MAKRPTRAILAAVALAGCAEVGTEPAIPGPPMVRSEQVGPTDGNVLGALVVATVRDADSVGVYYRLMDSRAGAAVTPAVAPADSVATVAVLGLFPDRRYELRVMAHGPGGLTIGDPLVFETGTLPVDLPRYLAGGPDPSPGFVVFAAGRYGVVLDNTGRVVWYRRFPDPGPGLSFMAQPTGTYAARPSVPGGPAPWVELDPLGRITRTLGCVGDLRPRPHDIQMETDGSYWLLCDESRVMDLSPLGGSATAVVTATAVQHVAADETLLFGWTPFDHFDIAEADPAELVKEAVNWTHGNALDVDPAGGVVVSFRNLSEVTRIDTRTGEVVWRLGGAANQFSVEGPHSPPFSGQHSARMIGPDTLLLLDNVGDPTESRAERYAIDETGRIARLTGSLGPGAGIITVLGGSVQGLPGGRTLVSYGTTGRVEEYDAEGRVVWRIDGNAGYVFRAQRILSLYAPGSGSPR